MSLKSYFKVVEKAKEPELESPTCSSRTKEKGDTDSSVSDEGDDGIVASPPKSTRSEQIKLSKSRMSFNPRWLHDFPWVRHDTIIDGAYCTICEKWGKPPPQARGTWVHQPFNAWKKAKEKMQEHAKSNWHKEACLLASEHERSLRQGTVVAMVQSVSQKERAENRNVMKKLLRCTYFLAKNRIAHTTNFSKLVQLVISCGANDLQRFLHDKVCNNAKYTSTTAVTDFIHAIAQWVERGLLQSLKQSPYYTLMGDECTDVSSMEELSLCFRWLKDGKPVEHFLEVLHVTRTDAETITSAITTYLQEKQIGIRNMRGMGFDGAATFSGNRTGVQD